MKYINYLIGLTTAALLLAGCQDEDLQDNLSEKVFTGKMVPVRMGFEMPYDTYQATTRSLVKGEEDLTNVNMDLLCFSEGGLFLGKFAATSISPNTDDEGKTGTLVAEVPEQTARVHFILNPPTDYMEGDHTGWLENRLMRDIAATTNVSQTKISYWGYHREDSYTAMQSYLNPTTTDGSTPTSNTIRLIRDRVQISKGSINNTTGIDSVKWTIYNGLEIGYLAPFDESQNTNPFIDTDSKNTSADLYDTPLTFFDGERYKNIEEEIVLAVSDLQSFDTPQFLFEDEFETDDNQKVGIILELTYSDSEHTKRYHRILLEDANKNNETLLRNHNYVLNIGAIPKASGSNNFTDALTAPPSNNAAVTVSPVVPEVSDGSYTLRLGSEGENTTKVYQVSDSNYKLVEFTLTTTDPTNSPLPADASGFTLTASSSANPAVPSDYSVQSFSPSNDNKTGQGIIQFKISNPGESLAYTKLLLTHKASGLNRSVEVYTNKQFDLSNISLTSEGIKDITVTKHETTYSDYAWVDNDGATYQENQVHYDYYEQYYYVTTGYGPGATSKQVWKVPQKSTITESSSTLEASVYKLSFTLPGGYPEGMYPMEIKFATSTLNPYSDDTATAEHGSFGVESGDTSGLTASSTTTDWNYDATNWNAWFVYTLTEKPSSNDITIYLYDVSGNRNPAPTSVGLFLQIDYFGKPYSVQVGSVSQLE